MGLGFSKEQQQGEGDGGGSSPGQQREEEAAAASAGALPMLRTAFSKLSHGDTRTIPARALEDLFSLVLPELQFETRLQLEHFPMLLANVGPSIVDLLFKNGDPGVSWLDFLRGYNRCCGRVSVSISLNIMLRLYNYASSSTQKPINLEFDSNEDDCKISGSVKLHDVLMVLWMCWMMEYYSRTSKFSERKSLLVLPDLCHLVISAFKTCTDNRDDPSTMDYEGYLDETVSVQKLHNWILTTIPSLANCTSQYVLARLQSTTDLETGSPEVELSIGASNDYLLTCGRAWAISLSGRSSTKELLESCFPSKGIKETNYPLYRSSIHGKGLSRFSSKIEGYHGPVLIVVSAGLKNTTEGNDKATNWIVAILTGQGVENKDAFYGTSGSLFALSPVFCVYPSSGKDKNFIYCHLRPTMRVYDPKPKRIGLAFGGTIGNERLFIDEDFTTITVRHHAVDKTYQPGSLFPNQGFLTIEASILDVEVWGLGGKSARAHQDAYKKRENLFTEQRRKVDLKTFSSWEDSPEKIMLDMVSDPNAARREDR